MTVKLITFKTTQTILGKVEETVTGYLIKEPVQVIVQPTKEGPMMGFAPFLEYAQEFKNGIEITKADVLCITTPIVELENQYNQVFGSGIQIASSIPKF
jgi:hypothetical protein